MIDNIFAFELFQVFQKIKNENLRIFLAKINCDKEEQLKWEDEFANKRKEKLKMKLRKVQEREQKVKRDLLVEMF